VNVGYLGDAEHRASVQAGVENAVAGVVYRVFDGIAKRSLGPGQVGGVNVHTVELSRG